VLYGKYMIDTRDEFPEAWFTDPKLAPCRRDCSLNYFGVAEASLTVEPAEGGARIHRPRA